MFCHPSCHWPGRSPALTRMELRDTALSGQNQVRK
ncbi:hypothetical protein LTSEMIN_3296, partial [Salmonella enterica subsp. enterica serovar Minnesota str. A4-603]